MILSPRVRSPQISYTEKGHPYVASSGRGRKTGLKSRGTQILALRFGWIVLIIWYEIGEFFHSLSSCKFPDSVLRRSTSKYAHQAATHVVLIADPHVPHPRLSYPRGSRIWVNVIRQFMDELFMRKSWNVVMRLGRIDVVIMLGDMLDWGRGVMDNAEYEEYFTLFREIFTLGDDIPMYFVPGNHDIPLGPNRMFSPASRDRYLRHFSPPNAVLPVANHTFVLLDSVGLVEEDYRRYAAEVQFGEWDGIEGGVIEFVKEVAEATDLGPKILITHIPLARQEAATCGPLRERGRIRKGAGPGYQNLLGSETTRFLLEELKPSVIYSGDDHDYCEHIHPGGIREVTVKTFSSSAGVRRPGLQLLSLIPPSDSNANPPQITFADRPCFLPDQLGVYYRVYLPLAILSISYLLFTNLRAAYSRWKMTRSNGSNTEGQRRGSTPYVGNDSTPNASTTARLGYERSVPLTLPSRRSSAQLNTISGSATLRSSARIPSQGMSPSLLSPRLNASTPASPAISPRPSFSEGSFSYVRDIRGGGGGVEDDGNESETTTTPNLSRRSSYVWMSGPNDHHRNNDREGTSSPRHTEQATNYFGSNHSGIPSPTGAIGLGLSTPTGQYGAIPSPNYSSHGTHRNSSGAASSSGGGGSGNGNGNGNLMYPQPQASRRVTIPRLLTSTGPQDWASAAKAKEKSMKGLISETVLTPGISGGGGGGGVFPHMQGNVHGHGHGHGGGQGVGKKISSGVVGFVKWLWRARNGVWLKTWREVLMIAWPAGLTWFVVNAAFFFG